MVDSFCSTTYALEGRLDDKDTLRLSMKRRVVASDEMQLIILLMYKIIVGHYFRYRFDEPI